MTTHPITETLLRFQTPAVRHLAWLCLAPPLLQHPDSFDPASYLPENTLARLLRWDANPELVPERLREPAERRLGHYFERLYEVLLTELLGWDMVLQNLQIRWEGRTLGELDFLVRNRQTGRLEHHEIAIKFYLGVVLAGDIRWYGPNARDRLDLKTDRLLNHQRTLSLRPETRARLASLGIRETVTPKVFMPGYLFYPANRRPVAAPEQVASAHFRGRWLYHRDLPSDSGIGHWVPLHKPHWIGPWQQTQAPVSDNARESLEQVAVRQVPRLFAELAPAASGDAWVEVDRVFVVPGAWPEPERARHLVADSGNLR
ncbi:DUF1853 domain-containing protein [Marinobacter fuscus]|uniref:DUF1853 domain-containing protein n=1 Tax=Marinobacter fuscus TaxID=2109942 RepID=A0A2T1KW68_9GAMM|nr:DUF1853 family protein [Marinobacter fuscus]PSF14334.1 DUF1853 domain-containing protein [Marinobacter fuscus]